MRLLFVAFITVLAVVLLTSFAQAGQVSVGAQNVIEEEPIGDHTWGGDPDGTAYDGWVHWWAFIMNTLYFFHLDVI